MNQTGFHLYLNLGISKYINAQSRRYIVNEEQTESDNP